MQLASSRDKQLSGFSISSVGDLSERGTDLLPVNGERLARDRQCTQVICASRVRKEEDVPLRPSLNGNQKSVLCTDPILRCEDVRLLGYHIAGDEGGGGECQKNHDGLRNVLDSKYDNGRIIIIKRRTSDPRRLD